MTTKPKTRKAPSKPSAVAAAIARHKTAQDAYDAAPDQSDETLIPLCEVADEALKELEETPCTSDAEFVEKLRYLFAEEVRLEFSVDSIHVAVATHLGEIEIRDSTWGRPMKSIIDPRNGDIEDHASSTKRRSLF